MEPNDNAAGEDQPATKPRFAYLREQFGKACVNVADCTVRDFSDQKRLKLTFDEFATVWENDGSYYLKDWHFCKAFPSYEAYKVPDLFAGKRDGRKQRGGGKRLRTADR